jgi:hypothetical protein
MQYIIRTAFILFAGASRHRISSRQANLASAAIRSATSWLGPRSLTGYHRG